jgi:hypothetical protein
LGFDTFTLRAHLTTPIIKGTHFATLDALLMAVRQCGDVTDMLRCEDELYFASSGCAVNAFNTQSVACVASMRPEHSPHWLDLLQPNTLNGDLKIGLARQREAGNVLNSYTATAALAIEWYATGNAEAVLATLRQVPSIGKRRASGYGEVSRWEVEPGELDGLVGYADDPLRPIPTTRWALGGDWIPVEAAWKAPYWDPRNRTRCFVPEMNL